MKKSFQVSRDKYPMIGKIIQKTDDSITCERTLSLETDHFLDHHLFNSTPFLPGVMGLELFAELGNILFPKLKIKQFEDVHFKSAIRLKEEKSCTFNGKVSVGVNGIVAEIITNPDEPKLHFKAKIVFGDLEKETQKVPPFK